MFDDLMVRIDKLVCVLRGGYGGHQDEVLVLVDAVHDALNASYGLVPIWEQEELVAARVYARSNWLLASVSALHKALVVSQLPDDDYWGGYTYTNPSAARSPRTAN